MAQSMTVAELYPLLKKSGLKWVDDKATKMSAALAYNTIIAIAPLLVVALFVFTAIYRNDAGALVKAQLSNLTEPQIADSLSTVLQAAMNKVSQGKSVVVTAFSVIVSVVGAQFVFGELQDSLNTIWGVKPAPGRSWFVKIKERLQPFILVGGIAFLLLVSTAVSTAITAVSGAMIKDTIGTDSYTAKMIGFLVDIVLSLVIVTGLFTAMFKILPDVEIKFRDTLLGGFVTAVLFEIGKYGLSLYMGIASPGSTFGAVGSIIVFLVWINYSAYILFFGAEFTQVYATSFGSQVKISDNAEPLDPRDAADYGLIESDRAAAERPAPRPRRRPVPRSHESPVGRRIGLSFVPALAGATLVRLTVKRYLHSRIPPRPLGDLWKEAAVKWKDAVLLQEPSETGR
jgi:membrane protein